eukprot:Selendium_serpulae@DN918_c0_g1_i1.p1
MPLAVARICNVLPAVEAASCIERCENSESVEETSCVDRNEASDATKEWLHPRGGIGPPMWDPILLFSSPGRGMDNKGNICFMNAAIQALVHCPPFAQGMLLGLHSKHCLHNGPKKSMRVVLLRRLCQEMLQ